MLLKYHIFLQIIPMVFAEMEVLRVDAQYFSGLPPAPALTVSKVKFISTRTLAYLGYLCSGVFHLYLYLRHHGPYKEHVMDILMEG